LTRIFYHDIEYTLPDRFRPETEMLEMLLEFLREIEKRDEFFDLMARVHKKSFDAMVKAGFTEDQAIRIIAGQGTGIQPR